MAGATKSHEQFRSFGIEVKNPEQPQDYQIGWPYISTADLKHDKEISELRGLVTKLSDEVNKLESVINSMGEKMKLCHSMNDEPFRDFTVILRPDDNGTFVAYVPAIPGCHAWGRTSQEAHAELANVFEMIKEEYEEENKPLPRDINIEINT